MRVQLHQKPSKMFSILLSKRQARAVIYLAFLKIKTKYFGLEF